MRWPQFLLTLINLGFSIYVMVMNVFLVNEIDPIIFLWTLIYLTLSIAICHLYMLYMTNKIDDWYDVESIKSISNLSVVFIIVSSVALLTHLGLEYYHKKSIMSTDSKSIQAIVPLVAALVCSAVLFSSSIKFKKYVILCRSTDLPTIQRPNYHTTDWSHFEVFVNIQHITIKRTRKLFHAHNSRYIRIRRIYIYMYVLRRCMCKHI